MASRRATRCFEDTDYLARDAHTFEEDGVKRAQHNPRMNSLAREIPRGAIYDRNGIPLATGNWDELERHRGRVRGAGRFARAGLFALRNPPLSLRRGHRAPDRAICARARIFTPRNASLVEHDSNAKLQGYDYAELAALVRYRHQPGNPAIARILARDRNVRLTLDIRLQLRAQRDPGAPPAAGGRSEGRGGGDGARPPATCWRW